jgi:hypothetical protein
MPIYLDMASLPRHHANLFQRDLTATPWRLILTTIFCGLRSEVQFSEVGKVLPRSLHLTWNTLDDPTAALET